MLPLISSLTDLSEAIHHTQKVRALRPVERKLTIAMQIAFRKQGQSFVKGLVKLRGQFPTENSESRYQIGVGGAVYRKLNEKISIDDTDIYFDTSDDDSFDLFRKPIEDAVNALLAAGARNILAELDVSLSFSLDNPRALTYIEQHGADLTAKINDETRSQIKTVLRQAVDEGWSYNQTAQQIIGRYDDMAVGVPGQFTSRAERIAVTECSEAYEEGNWIPIQDLAAGGVQTEKKWDVAPELSQKGPCDECQANADEGWIPSDQPHQSGDEHPLQHVGCYCDEYYQVKE
jgi:hypothetical protein